MRYQKSEHGKARLKEYRQKPEWKQYNREYQKKWQQAKRLEEALMIERLNQIKLVGF